MHARAPLVTLAAALLLTPLPARGREGGPTPGTVTLRCFECDLGRTGEAVVSPPSDDAGEEGSE